MQSRRQKQIDRAPGLFKRVGIARHSELIRAGISPTTISRMQSRGLIRRLGRGLYQLADAPLDANHTLAAAAKIAPRGVICLVSALAYHELTDAIPARVWVAIGPKDRKPRATRPPLQFVRFGAKTLRDGVAEHRISGVKVQIYSPAKTVVDLFRYRQRAVRRFQMSPGLDIALEGLREALRQRKATPAQIARYAIKAGVWKSFEPYLHAMTANA